MAGQEAFPMNVCRVLKATLEEMIGDEFTILLRPLRATDPVKSVAVTAQRWLPEDGTAEIGGGASMMQSLSQYSIVISTLIKSADYENAISSNSELLNQLRAALRFSPALRAKLGALVTGEAGVFRERFQRSWVANQQYVTNEIDGYHYHLTITELFVETETVSE